MKKFFAFILTAATVVACQSRTGAGCDHGGRRTRACGRYTGIGV